jgi:hypothetical protein
MAHSIEMLLDDSGDAAIRSAWQALADAGLPSQARVGAATNRPHITLLAAAGIGAGADDPLRGLAARLPFAGVLGAPLVFGGPRHTLARLVVPSAQLLELHAEVYRLALGQVTGEVFAHCRPGCWTPHATLGRRLAGTDVGAALACLGEAVADLQIQITGLRRWDGDRRVEHLLVS